MRAKTRGRHNITYRILALCVALLLAFAAFSRAASSSGATTHLRYLALGDSITAAQYEDGGGFVTRYAADMSRRLGVPIETRNFGEGGLKSDALLTQLRDDDDLRDAVATADVVTVFIGMNDFIFPALDHVSGSCGGEDNQECLRLLQEAFGTNIESIFSEIASLNNNPSLLLRAADLFYPVAASDQGEPYRPVLQPVLVSMNAKIHTAVDAGGGRAAHVFAAFNGEGGEQNPYALGYLQEDGVHPTAAGFDKIAAAFRATGLVPLVAPGDSDCDGVVSAIDAALILQHSAALISEVPCPVAADSDADGDVTAVDSALVLQTVAGLL